MWTLARKNLLKERVWFVISVGGVAFAVRLIIVLPGLFGPSVYATPPRSASKLARRL